jgi:hypothetical protein
VKKFAFTLLFLACPARAETPELPLRFAFADRSDSRQVVELQGNVADAALFPKVCGKGAANCFCEFRDSSGKLLGKSGNEKILYDPDAVFFRCDIPGGISQDKISETRLVGPSGKASNWLRVKQPMELSLADVLGTGLNFNLARGIYRYVCESTYLEKAGTTQLIFDCSNQKQQCDENGNFCLLKTRTPYFLYSDSYGSNFSLMPSDRLYNSGFGICGLEIKQLDCVSGTKPELRFGVYEGQVGIWNSALSLAPSPDNQAELEGFAAKVSKVTGDCPPGLVPMNFYHADLPTAAISGASNLPTDLVVTDLGPENFAPDPLVVARVGGGNCDGTACTMPRDSAAPVATAPFQKSGQETFCVIPARLLNL